MTILLFAWLGLWIVLSWLGQTKMAVAALIGLIFLAGIAVCERMMQII